MNILTDTAKQKDISRYLDPAYLVRWGLYPLLISWYLLCISYVLLYPAQLRELQMLMVGTMLTVLFACEWWLPYQKRWGMTWGYLLKRDLVFIGLNGVTMGLLSIALVSLAIEVSEFTQGPMAGKPLWIQFVVAILSFEAIQYSVHRIMHESRGPVTNFLWRSHAIHHLPQQLYVVMHAVFHPFNAIIVRLVVQMLPLWFWGFDPMAVFISYSIIGFHGTISHFNVDLRMGWLNYVFIGPELHRYHHSANSHDAVNYGAALSLFDLLGKTFLYRPGIAPRELGLKEENGYPGQIRPLASFLFAFSTHPVTASPKQLEL